LPGVSFSLPRSGDQSPVMRTRVLRERFPGVRAGRLCGVLAPCVVKSGRLSAGLGSFCCAPTR
jgi:hypothetical protein